MLGVIASRLSHGRCLPPAPAWLRRGPRASSPTAASASASCCCPSAALLALVLRLAAVLHGPAARAARRGGRDHRITRAPLGGAASLGVIVAKARHVRRGAGGAAARPPLRRPPSEEQCLCYAHNMGVSTCSNVELILCTCTYLCICVQIRAKMLLSQHHF